MKDNYTHITFVLDNSGSMASLTTDTIGGFNTFLKSQKEAPGTATFSLHQFSYLPENPVLKTYDFEDVRKVPDLDRDSYSATGGSTPLLDAIGESIKSVGEKFVSMNESDRPSKVLFVILTDGHENSSRRYNRTTIKDMIKLQTEAYKWEFIFLGANQDSIGEAGAMGIAPTRAMNYVASSVGVSSTYDVIGTKMSMFRTTGNLKDLDFTEEERTKSMGQ